MTEADLKRARNLDEGIMTMRQQVKYLLACVRKREQEEQAGHDFSPENSEQYEDNVCGHFAESECQTEFVEPLKGRNSVSSISLCANPRTLEVISEEPSKLDYVSVDKSRNIIPTDAIAGDENSSERRFENSSNEEETDSSDCTSSCSCCQDTTNYTSRSVSIVAEETIYSPQKNELSHAFRCTKIDQSSWEVNRENHNEKSLKTLLQTRLNELEAEIGAFKIENSHLGKLRSDYEKEYNQFCKERVALLKRIKEEHLSGTKELEKDKRKLQCEKSAFERYMREVKSRPSKEEKEEIRLLKEEMKLLREEMNKKESRWAAAQARIRTEMKMLKDRNSSLQTELKELKKTPKKVTFAPVLKRSKSSNVNVGTRTDASKLVEKNANKFISLSRSTRESTPDLPMTPDSGIFTDTIQSSNDSCDGISEELRRSVCLSSYLNADAQTDGFGEDIPASETSFKDTSDVDISESTDSCGNREKVYADGRREIWCANGSVKKISSDGNIMKTIFYNGDVEEVNVEEDVVKYYHAANKMWHSKFGDGLEIKEFCDGQIEKYFKDGSSEITSPDGTLFTTTSTGEKKWSLEDGTLITIDQTNQEKRIVFTNGQIEIHTPEFKRREYPDGTMKIVYNGSGMQETRYPNGRIRLKSQDGTLISDTNIT